MLEDVRAGLVKSLDTTLVDELLAAYSEMKHNFYLGGLRLSAVEGGRFCEAAFRLLEQAAFRKFTPLGKQLDTEKLILTLGSQPPTVAPDAVRIHIPRALRVVYDIRNKRDTAHLADGIDPNVQDATLVMGTLDWVMAEFVRIYHSVTADAAYLIIERMVTRKAPAVEDFDGFLKVLRPNLKVSDYALLTLFESGKAGATYQQIEAWVQPKMRKNLKRTMDRLVNEQALAHFAAGKYVITKLGIIGVEKRRLHELI